MKAGRSAERSDGVGIAIIGVLGFVCIGAAFSEGQTGAAILGIVIVAVLLLMGHEERKDTKAWRNCLDYWAAGGPEKRR